MSKKISNQKNGLDSKEKKLLSPKLDVVFQALFGEVGNEKITAKFLECILQRKITEIELNQNPILRRETELDKLGILDICTKINKKEICNIEMQLANKDDFIKRIVFYWGRVYTKQIKKGEKYRKLQKTIAIIIVDFKIEHLKDLKYHSEWAIIDKGTRKVILTEELEIHIIELPKIRETDENSELLDWLHFIENPKSRRVIEKMKENKELKKAVERLQEISEDEYMQRIAELREKAIRDEEAGRSWERKQGITQGIGQGRKEAKREDAKKMLEKNIPVKVISEITGLSKKEIEEIRKDVVIIV